MKKTSTTWLFCVVQICGVYVMTTMGVPDITFKRVSDYTWIYDDSGTGANVDVSIWRPKDNQAGYCPLGDVAFSSHSKPGFSALTVSAVKSGSLTNPTGFTEIWNDQGSGGTHDVRIMRMNAAAGYKCIGHVAVRGYSNLPDKTKYCCVQEQYLTNGYLDKVWQDQGSGASKNVGLWQVVKGGLAYGTEASTFLSVANNNKPSETPYLLKESDKVMSAISQISSQQRPLNVYEVTELTTIWTDSGSGANSDLSIYRANAPAGFYSLGDIAVGSYTKPRVGYLAKEITAGSLKPPVDFREKWNDGGSGASQDVKIWEPICSSGYRAIGYVARASYSSRPSSSDVRCVKAEHTIRGAWAHVWKDSGSGANQDVNIWRASATSSSGQGLEAMSAVRSHGNMDRDAYVLSTSSMNYYSDRPVKSYVLTNVVYDLDQKNVLDVQPDSLGTTLVINKGDLPQTSTRSMSYSYTESYSWSSTFGVEIGVSCTVTAGVPLIGAVETTVSVTTSYSYTWGGQTDETKDSAIAAEITVPGKSQILVTITGRRYKADVPYTATLRKTYEDGTQTEGAITGVYRGVTVSDVTVVYGAAVPI